MLACVVYGGAYMKHLICFDEKRRVFYSQIDDEITPDDYQEISMEMTAFPERKESEIRLDISRTEKDECDREITERLGQSALQFSIPLDDLPYYHAQSDSGSRFSHQTREEDAWNKAERPQKARLFKTVEQALSWLRNKEPGEAQSLP